MCFDTLCSFGIHNVSVYTISPTTALERLPAAAGAGDVGRVRPAARKKPLLLEVTVPQRGAVILRNAERLLEVAVDAAVLALKEADGRV